MREGALSRQDAAQLVETAAAAPSMHNLQPWRFVARLSDRVIEIYADPARALRGADPRGRAVHIACGAALFNLRLAIANAGAEPVARLLPNLRDPLLLASVRVAGPHRPHPGERDLHAALHSIRPGTSLLPLASRAAVPSMLPALSEAAALEGASLRTLERTEALRLVQAILATDRSAHADPRFLAELAEFMPDRPASSASRHAAAPDGAGKLAVLSTRADDRASWLRAGQALQRVLLLAKHRGLPAAPLSPVLDPGEGPHRPDPRFGSHYPEMILRLGAEPAGSLLGNPVRRPVSQVMRVVTGMPVAGTKVPAA